MRDDYIAGIVPFVRESFAIEGYDADEIPDDAYAKTQAFLGSNPSVESLCSLVSVYTNDRAELRVRPGLDVRIGNYLPPRGGAQIKAKLIALLDDLTGSLHRNPWEAHCQYELLHPFTDGNGRSGRALWAWHMTKLGIDPFRLPFLQRFYYQTLQNKQ